MTEYVLVERGRWERVRASALHNGTSPHIQPGDLDPVEPDEEPSVEEMLDAITGEFRIEWVVYADGSSTLFAMNDGDYANAFGGDNWLEALRATYRKKVNETCRQ